MSNAKTIIFILVVLLIIMSKYQYESLLINAEEDLFVEPSINFINDIHVLELDYNLKNKIEINYIEILENNETYYLNKSLSEEGVINLNLSNEFSDLINKIDRDYINIAIYYKDGDNKGVSVEESEETEKTEEIEETEETEETEKTEKTEETEETEKTEKTEETDEIEEIEEIEETDEIEETEEIEETDETDETEEIREVEKIEDRKKKGDMEDLDYKEKIKEIRKRNKSDINKEKNKVNKLVYRIDIQNLFTENRTLKENNDLIKMYIDFTVNKNYSDYYIYLHFLYNLEDTNIFIDRISIVDPDNKKESLLEEFNAKGFIKDPLFYGYDTSIVVIKINYSYNGEKYIYKEEINVTSNKFPSLDGYYNIYNKDTYGNEYFIRDEDDDILVYCLNHKMKHPDNNSGTFGYKKYDFFSNNYNLHYKGGYNDVSKVNIAALLYAGYDVGTDRLGIVEYDDYWNRDYTQTSLWKLEEDGVTWYGSPVTDLGVKLLYFAIDMNVIKGYYQDEIIDNSFLDTVIGDVELELLGKDNKYFITFKNQNTQNKKGSIFINDSGKFKLAKEDKILLSKDGQYKLSLNKKYEIIPNENQDMIKLDYEYEEIEVSVYKEDGFYSSEYQDMIRLDTINHRKEKFIKIQNDKYLKLIKKDGYDETPLKGAEFLINELNYTSDENGEILIKLDLDSYEIKESKAPSGYILKKDKIKIIKKGEHYYLNNKLLEFNDGLAYINIYNYKKPILPNTGYVNTNINNLIGLVLIVLSSMIYKRKIP